MPGSAEGILPGRKLRGSLRRETPSEGELLLSQEGRHSAGSISNGLLSKQQGLRTAQLDWILTVQESGTPSTKALCWEVVRS